MTVDIISQIKKKEKEKENLKRIDNWRARGKSKKKKIFSFFKKESTNEIKMWKWGLKKKTIQSIYKTSTISLVLSILFFCSHLLGFYDSKAPKANDEKSQSRIRIEYY